MNPLVAAAGITAGAGLLGSAGTAVGNAAMAKRTMDWQERMSNTAYQRAATDLEAAGLNRILALGSPATTPGGATAQFPDFGSSMAQGAQVGISYGSQAQQIAKSEQETLKVIEETKVVSEKLAQEMAKTPAVQQVLKPIAEGATSINQVTQKIGEQIPDLIFEFGDWSRQKLDAFDQILRSHLDDYDGSGFQILIKKGRAATDAVAPNPFYEHKDINIGEPKNAGH